MSDKINIVGNLSERYSDKPIIRSLLHLLPGWDSADVLLQQRTDEIRSERKKTFFDELAAGKHELNEDLIQSEDFLHKYFSTVKAAINTRQREKIRQFARLLDASATPDLLFDSDEYDELLSTLDSISLREFKALVVLNRLECENPKLDSENDYQKIERYWAKYQQDVIESLKISEGFFDAFMVRLERTGLFLRLPAGYGSPTGTMGQTSELFRRLYELVVD